MGLNYNELISKNSENKILKSTLYREKTNVFVYYILKMILLYDYDHFLSWCQDNNSLLLKLKVEIESLFKTIEPISNISNNKESFLINSSLSIE